MKLLPWDSRAIRFNRAERTKFMITETRITFRKVIKSNINHTFDVELRHVAIIDAYVETSLISVSQPFSWRNRSTVRRKISRYRTHGIAAKYIASNFSLHAQKRHPHFAKLLRSYFNCGFFHVGDCAFVFVGFQRAARQQIQLYFYWKSRDRGDREEMRISRST